MVLGRYADVRETAERLPATVWIETCQAFDRTRLVCTAVERVRRHFERKSKARGNKYARVAYAYFQRRSWHKTGLPQSSFFHALKKVKEFFKNHGFVNINKVEEEFNAKTKQERNKNKENNEINIGFQLDNNFTLQAMMTMASNKIPYCCCFEFFCF
jgi:hypothetical protein